MTDKLENNYTKEVLALLEKFEGPQLISQPGNPVKGQRIPRVLDFEGQWDLIIELPQQSRDPQLAGISPFEGVCHYRHYIYHSLISGQTRGREHSPTHQQKIG